MPNYERGRRRSDARSASAIMPEMHPHARLLRDWLAADRGDVDAFDRYLHPGVIVHAPLGLSTRGVEAEKAVWADAKSGNAQHPPRGSGVDRP